MKRILLIMVITACCLNLVNCIDHKPFSPKDTRVLNVAIDMELDKVVSVLGKPARIESQFSEAFGGDILKYYYIFGYLVFDPLDANRYTISEIVVNKSGFKGPRGIMVGDSVNSVLSKFPYDPSNSMVGNRSYIYGRIGEDYGCIEYGDAMEIRSIIYSYGGGGFGTYALSINVSGSRVVEIGLSVMNI